MPDPKPLRLLMVATDDLTWAPAFEHVSHCTFSVLTDSAALIKAVEVAASLLAGGAERKWPYLVDVAGGEKPRTRIGMTVEPHPGPWLHAVTPVTFLKIESVPDEEGGSE